MNWPLKSLGCSLLPVIYQLCYLGYAVLLSKIVCKNDNILVSQSYCNRLTQI